MSKVGKPRRAITIGETFGRKIVTGEAGKQGPHYMVHVQCDCGHQTTVQYTALTYGRFQGPCTKCPDYGATRTKRGPSGGKNDAAITELFHEGTSIKDITQAVGMTKTGIYLALDRLGLRTIGDRKAMFRQLAEEVRQLLNEGMVQADIAAKLKVSQSFVSRTKLRADAIQCLSANGWNEDDINKAFGVRA